MQINIQFIAQLIGFVALGLQLWVYQLNKRKSMLNWQLWSNFLFSIHFFLLGAYTGSALNFVGAGRSYTFNKYRHKKWSAVIFWGFIGIFILAGALTWQGPLSILPVIGMVSGAFAYWQHGTRHIRTLSLIAPPAWFIYNAFNHSYAGMVTEIVIIASILIGKYRHDRYSRPRLRKLNPQAHGI